MEERSVVRRRECLRGLVQYCVSTLTHIVIKKSETVTISMLLSPLVLLQKEGEGQCRRQGVGQQRPLQEHPFSVVLHLKSLGAPHYTGSIPVPGICVQMRRSAFESATRTMTDASQSGQTAFVPIFVDCGAARSSCHPHDR